MSLASPESATIPASWATAVEQVITVRGLEKIYGAKRAVDGLDLDVKRGEIFAILGPNGAGKTTTIEILEGFRVRNAGQVDVLGEDPGVADRVWRSRIGVVLQDSSDLGDLTVAEALGTTACYYPDPRRPEDVIKAVGLAEKANARIRTLSGGQRRRVDVALGIIGRPELLFLDEPTTGFDPEVRRQFWDLILALRADGTTIILTTHYLDEAEALADRVAVICAGRVVAVDCPQTLGGPDARTPVVRWTDPSGEACEQRTERPDVFVANLLHQMNGTIPNLTITRPTLEEVYLGLISSGAPATTSEEMEALR